MRSRWKGNLPSFTRENKARTNGFDRCYCVRFTGEDSWTNAHSKGLSRHLGGWRDIDHYFICHYIITRFFFYIFSTHFIKAFFLSTYWRFFFFLHFLVVFWCLLSVMDTYEAFLLWVGSVVGGKKKAPEALELHIIPYATWCSFFYSYCQYYFQLFTSYIKEILFGGQFKQRYQDTGQ